MESYWKYLKAIIFRSMENNIADLVVDLGENNQGRSPKLSVLQKRNILRQTKRFKKKPETFV